MDTVFHLITLLSIGFTIMITALMLFNFRKERRISAFSLLLSAILSLAILVVFTLLTGAKLNLLLALPILALGLLVGFLRGLTTQLYYKKGQVVGRNSQLFLLGWGGSLALAQVLTLFGSALLASMGLIPLFLSTGIQVGMNGNVLIRRLMMQPPPPDLSTQAVAALPLSLPERARAINAPSHNLPK